jgi:hypothetical protein
VLVQDAVGIDKKLLDEVQSRIVSFYASLHAPYDPSAVKTVDEVFLKCVESSMYKATNALLDDLHRNYRLLGTPERCIRARWTLLRLLAGADAHPAFLCL